MSVPDNVINFPTPSPPEVKTTPCPFCGCAEVELSGGEDDVCMQCVGCFAEGPVATIGCRDPDEESVELEAEALELWNRRHQMKKEELRVGQVFEDVATGELFTILHVATEGAGDSLAWLDGDGKEGGGSATEFLNEHRRRFDK